MRRLTEDAAAEVQAVIDDNRDRFAGMRDLIGLEPGFPIVNGKLVREPAIIAYVRRKRPPSQLLPEERAPRSIGGFKVDVIQPGPAKAVELDPAAAGLTDMFEAAAASGLTYEGIPGDPIDRRVRIERPILCHAGPDSGWVVLRSFLEATRDELVVCMYDFSADYISNSLIGAARTGGFPIELTLDDGVNDKEREIQERLREKLPDQYRATIIRCAQDRRFPSAYHPKVAVQDERKFWLSSGNWSPRSQPEIDPLGDPASAKGMYSRGNREWHVVVDDAPLAKLFKRYILHDKSQAEADAALGDEVLPGMPDLFVALDDLLAEAESAALAEVEPTPPAALPDDGQPFHVQPLLSPDNYARRISEWIRGAQSSLYLQYSYITYSTKPVDVPFRELLDDLGELSWRDDFDLRIIVGSGDVEKVRKLAENGFNERALRVQRNIHNKAIVRDGTEALVSSQNWSGDGFLRNRDAGLIIENAQIAGYFADVFLEDWALRARDPFEGAGLSAEIAAEGAPTPAGMVRMTWSEFFGE